MTTALSIPSKGTAAAADAFLGETDGLGGLLLPTVSIGEGVFVPAKGNDPSDMDKLPDGSKARPGIFIATRNGVLSWKVGYDTKGEDDAPAFVAMIPDSNLDDIKLAGQAVKARQFCSKDNKPERFDFATSGVGHLKPLKEHLVYFVDTGFTIIAHSPNYHDVVDATTALKKLVDPDTGEINMAPAMFAPVKKPHKSAKWTWDACFCDVEPIKDAKVKDKLAAQFAEYRALISENLVVKAAVDAWLNCTDRPLTDEHREALRKGIALNPPKF